MKEQIQSLLHTECPWRDTLYWYPVTDSTNTRAKLMAQQGAPHGTVIIAGEQSQGRGRLGRSFHSPAGTGLYLSVLLRPACKPDALMHLTCAAAVAAVQAVNKVSGLQPNIKWINDLVLDGKKLGGILAELSCDAQTGLVDHAIIGIGINCLQTPEDFPDEIASLATSLLISSGTPVQPCRLAAALIESLFQMAQGLFCQKDKVMALYRQSCITVGKQIRLVRGDEDRTGFALDVDENGALIVSFDEGPPEIIQSGEASVRGMYGYL